MRCCSECLCVGDAGLSANGEYHSLRVWKRQAAKSEAMTSGIVGSPLTRSDEPRRAGVRRLRQPTPHRACVLSLPDQNGFKPEAESAAWRGCPSQQKQAWRKCFWRTRLKVCPLVHSERARPLSLALQLPERLCPCDQASTRGRAAGGFDRGPPRRVCGVAGSDPAGPVRRQGREGLRQWHVAAEEGDPAKARKEGMLKFRLNGHPMAYRPAQLR